MSSKFADYSFGRVQDPYEGLRKSLSGVGKRFDTHMARERQKDLDMQKLIQESRLRDKEAREAEQFGWLKEQYKTKQDKEAGELFVKEAAREIPMKTTTEKVTNQNTIDRIMLANKTAAKANELRLQKDPTAKLIPYQDVPEPITKTETTPVSREQFQQLLTEKIKASDNPYVGDYIGEAITTRYGKALTPTEQLSRAAKKQELLEDKAYVDEAKEKHGDILRGVSTVKGVDRALKEHEKEQERVEKKKKAVTFSTKNKDKFISRLDIPLETRTLRRNDSTLLRNFIDDKKIQEYMTKNKVTADAFSKIVKAGLKLDDDLEDVLQGIADTWVKGDASDI